MTKFYLSIVSLILVVSTSCNQPTSIMDSSFDRSLAPGKYILDAPVGWWHWGMAPIYDDNDKLHIFMSAIPNAGSWKSDSKIVHYMADGPEGPYEFVDTVFSSDQASYHNPQISKIGDKYVLVFLLRDATERSNPQEIGIAISESVYGPWTESPLNPIIKAAGRMNGANINHASNPTFLVDEDGRYRIYYKSMTDKYKSGSYREISLAISDNITGPYENHPDNPLISYAESEVDIEDPYAFYYNSTYYMIVEDRTGVKDLLEGNFDPNAKPGGNRPGLIYTSKDGIDWGIPEIGYQTNEYYFGDALARTERPHILWKNGNPDCLFLACHDEHPSAGFFLKIEHWQ